MTGNQKIINYKLLGERIKAGRLRLDLTQADVGAAVGIGESFYGKIERGDMKPSLERLAAICIVLHLPLTEVVAGIIHTDVPLDNTTGSDEQYLSAFQQILERCPDPQKKQIMLSICNAIQQLE